MAFKVRPDTEVTFIGDSITDRMTMGTVVGGMGERITDEQFQAIGAAMQLAQKSPHLVLAAPEMLALLRDCHDLFVREGKPLLAAPIAALLKRIDG